MPEHDPGSDPDAPDGAGGDDAWPLAPAPGDEPPAVTAEATSEGPPAKVPPARMTRTTPLTVDGRPPRPPAEANAVAKLPPGSSPPPPPVELPPPVADPAPTPPPARPKRQILARTGFAIYRALVAVGLFRGRQVDGSFAPRHWGRLLGIAGGALAVYLVVTMLHIVPTGAVGVPVTFGNTGAPLESGLHATLPWPLADVVEMPTRTQNYTMTSVRGEGALATQDDSVSVLGRDGAGANVDATVLYRVAPGRADAVFADVGVAFQEKLIRPTARACIRAEFTRYTLVSAATDAWDELSKQINDCMKAKVEPHGIIVQDFQLREVSLGEKVQQAVDAKVASQQNAERQRYELSTSQQQADIDRIKALATADAQQILACGGDVVSEPREGAAAAQQVVRPRPIEQCNQAQLTPAYLQFTYIQALKNLVNSPNNSTIILPFDQNLTPLINAGGGGTAPDTSPPDTTPPAAAPAP